MAISNGNGKQRNFPIAISKRLQFVKENKLLKAIEAII